MDAFATVAAFDGFLQGLGLFHMDLSLTRIKGAIQRLVAPEPPLAAVQVLGTNGKGTTAGFLAALATAHGLTGGLYTSPHFVGPRERIRLDGRMPGDAVWLELANAVHAAQAEPLTYFEYLTAMAAAAFARPRDKAGKVFAVYEAGLGGRHDATTALPVDLCVFAPMGLDHQAILGATLEEIAADKAAAIRPRGMALTGPQPGEAMAAIEAEAGSKQAEVHHLADALPDWALGILPRALRGTYLEDNALLALAAWNLASRFTGRAPDLGACRRALAQPPLPGRLQFVPGEAGAFPDLILDGAHNPAGLHALRRSLGALEVSPGAVVFTCLRDKDLAAMAAAVREWRVPLVVAPELPGVERARPARETAAAVGPSAETAQGVGEALRRVEPVCREAERPALLCGSLYLLADFFTLRPLLLEPRVVRPGAGDRDETGDNGAP